jgi:hypothetical protein
MPTAPPPELKEFLRPYDPPVRSLFLKVRAVVRDLAPPAHETVWDAYNAVATGFSFTGKWTQGFIHIAAYSTHVNLGFNNGASLPDPEGLLEGKGNRVRHLKIVSAKDLSAPHVGRFIRAAIAHNKSLGYGTQAKAKAVIRRMRGPRRRPKQKPKR